MSVQKVSCMKKSWHENFMHEHFIFMHGNFVLSYIKMIFPCLKIKSVLVFCKSVVRQQLRIIRNQTDFALAVGIFCNIFIYLKEDAVWAIKFLATMYNSNIFLLPYIYS